MEADMLEKINWKQLGIALAIPLAVGGLSAFLTKDSMKDFAKLKQPPLSPPGWLFPVVWTILYILMGIASYLVYQQKQENRVQVVTALTLYGIQLFFNFFWSIFFFNLEWFFFALLWLIVLWILVLYTQREFSALDKRAGYCLIPYILWSTFAIYLNAGVALLNR